MSYFSYRSSPKLDTSARTPATEAIRTMDESDVSPSPQLSLLFYRTTLVIQWGQTLTERHLRTEFGTRNTSR